MRDARADRDGPARPAGQGHHRQGARPAARPARPRQPRASPARERARRRAQPARSSYATVDLTFAGRASGGAAPRVPATAGRPATRSSDAGRVLEVIAGVLRDRASRSCCRSRILAALAALREPRPRRAAAASGRSKRRERRRTCARRPGVVDTPASDGEHTGDGRAARPGARSSRRWRRRTSSWWPRSATRGASARARSSSARATSPTRATSSAPATRARSASTPTAARSRSPRSGPGDIFGELAMFDDERRSATVETIDALEVLAILGPDMRRLMLRRPQLAVALAASLVAPPARRPTSGSPASPSRPCRAAWRA